MAQKMARSKHDATRRIRLGWVASDCVARDECHKKHTSLLFVHSSKHSSIKLFVHRAPVPGRIRERHLWKTSVCCRLQFNSSSVSLSLSLSVSASDWQRKGKSKRELLGTRLINRRLVWIVRHEARRQGTRVEVSRN